MDELKPCPFCGEQAEVYETPSNGYTIVARHDDCCCFSNLMWGRGYETEEEAIEAWNRRANDES